MRIHLLSDPEPTHTYELVRVLMFVVIDYPATSFSEQAHLQFSINEKLLNIEGVHAKLMEA